MKSAFFSVWAALCRKYWIMGSKDHPYGTQGNSPHFYQPYLLIWVYLHVERTGGGKGGNTAPIPVQRLPPLRPLRGVPGLSSISTPVCNPLVGDENHDAPVLSFTSPTVPVKTQPFPGHHRQSTAVEEGAATRPHASCSSLEQIRCVERPHMDTQMHTNSYKL